MATLHKTRFRVCRTTIIGIKSVWINILSSSKPLTLMKMCSNYLNKICHTVATLLVADDTFTWAVLLSNHNNKSFNSVFIVFAINNTFLLFHCECGYASVSAQFSYYIKWTENAFSYTRLSQYTYYVGKCATYNIIIILIFEYLKGGEENNKYNFHTLYSWLCSIFILMVKWDEWLKNQSYLNGIKDDFLCSTLIVLALQSATTVYTLKYYRNDKEDILF